MSLWVVVAWCNEGRTRMQIFQKKNFIYLNNQTKSRGWAEIQQNP